MPPAQDPAGARPAADGGASGLATPPPPRVLVYEEALSGPDLRTRTVVRLADPVTGRDLPGYASLDLGLGGVLDHAVSPDGAVAVFLLSRGNGSLEVRTVDVKRWRPGPQPALDPAYFAERLAFNRDGQRLYAFSMPGRRLRILDGRTFELVAEAKLDFFPARLFLSPEHETAYLFGNSDAGNSDAGGEGRALLAVLDGRTGREKGRLALPVRVGQLNRDGRPVTYQPALVLAPDGRRFFAVHADVDAVTVVDLVEGRILGTYALQGSASIRWRDTVAALLGGIRGRAALAKNIEGAYRLADISPDGRWLATTVYRCDDRFRCSAGEVQVVDVATMRVVARPVAGAGRPLFSPDGLRLFVTAGPFADAEGRDRGLTIVEAGTWRVVARAGGDALFHEIAVDAGGRYVYLSGPGPDSGREGRRPSDRLTTVTVVDAERGVVTASRPLTGFGGLILAPSAGGW